MMMEIRKPQISRTLKKRLNHEGVSKRKTGINCLGVVSCRVVGVEVEVARVRRGRKDDQANDGCL